MHENITKTWRIARIAILAVFVAAQVLFAVTHESWQDEAQAWLIVQNLNLPEIFSLLKVEGHPALWYLVLFPFAKLGAPMLTMRLISCAAVGIAAWLLLWRSPFPHFIQVFILLSALFTYYLPVISRSYALALLLIVAASACYKHRLEHPVQFGIIAALLFQTHVILMGLALGMIVILALDCISKSNASRRAWIVAGIAIALLGMIATYLELSGGAASSSLADKILPLLANPLSLFTTLMGDLAVNLASYGVLPAPWRRLEYVLLLALTFASLLLPLIFAPKRNWRAFLLAFFGLGAQLAISVFVYYSINQRTLFFWAILLLTSWIVLDDAAPMKHSGVVKNTYIALFTAFFIFTAPVAWYSAIQDVRLPYSGSVDMGSYLESEVEPGTVIVSGCASATESVVVYAPDFVYWHPKADVTFTYCNWGTTREEIVQWNEVLGIDEMLARYTAAYPEAQTMYLLADQHVERPADMEAYIIREQPNSILEEETFRLYAIPVNR